MDDASPEALEAMSIQVDYRLTDANFEKWEIAQRNLDRLPRSAFPAEYRGGGGNVEDTSKVSRSGQSEDDRRGQSESEESDDDTGREEPPARDTARDSLDIVRIKNYKLRTTCSQLVVSRKKDDARLEVSASYCTLLRISYKNRTPKPRFWRDMRSSFPCIPRWLSSAGTRKGSSP